MSLIEKLPEVRGRYRDNVPLADTTWFRVGGAAQVVFKPADVEDLAHFLKELDSRLRGSDETIPVTVLGAASNIVVRDGGIDGVVIRLGRGFHELHLDPVIARSNGDEAISGANSQEIAAPTASAHNDAYYIVAGAANLDVNVAQFALQQSVQGLEFLSGIPGAIGGALRMNAGAYGREIKDVLVKAEFVTAHGEIQVLTVDELGFSYRHCSLPEDVIFTRAWFKAEPDNAQAIAARMQEIQTSRADTQPIRARTGGSTFRNPTGYKAWELIDAAQLRGMMVGGAQVSEKHCNFLINTGTATAADLERLTQRIIEQVKNHSGITLEPEIKFIGKK